MEAELEFQNAVSILKELERQKAALSDEVIEKAQEEAIECIESQFERCFLVLASRKQQLLGQVAETIQEQKKHKEIHEKQLYAAIEGCKKLLEASTALYAQHRGASMTILKGSSELKHEVTLSTGIAVNFDPEMMEKFDTYGSVYTPERNIASVATSPPITPVIKKERVIVLAGSNPGIENGSGENAKFAGPRGICLNPRDDCLYVCDGYNNIVRKVTLQGEVTTFAAQKGDFQLCNPYGIALFNFEDSFFVTSMLQHQIKKISSQGVISVLAGTGKPGNKDNKDGKKAVFHCPAGITVDQTTGNLYVCDQNNHTIRKITPQGIVSTLAGTGQAGYMDGASASLFNFPTGLAFVDKEQYLVVCDTANNKLRKVSLAGSVSTMCQIAEPTDVTMDNNGKLYVSTYSNVIVTFARNATGIWVKEGESIKSNFEGPHGIVIDEKSNSCFVADCDNNRICKITL
eukprot:Phypoly_transcript_09032.p1 GENE.Phypoly_transcript_09032~~Phypoly_transcript_09032.p1  ORF type:complete len:460 (-),score=68.95 Phypoly_transcript_09032:16-1395(-)